MGREPWYIFGTQRFAKITPTQDQQPDVLTRDLGRKDKADPNEALFQALTSYLYQRHEDQNGLEYPFVAVLIEPSPGQLQVLDHDAYAELVATDTTYSAHFRHKWTFWDSRHAVALKRYDSDKEVLLSVEELLNEGKSKSGANGLPFYYLPPEHSTTLKEVTYYLHDHPASRCGAGQGNMRLTYSIPCVDGTQVPTLLHAADYYPYGSILRQHINGAQEKYLTTHHERDLETGLDYRGARYYDSDVARFLSLDPLAADYASWSPYNYVMGNPVSMVDPDGRSASPIYDRTTGDLLGTDDQGLTGPAIVMEREQFSQGMSHTSAMAIGTMLDNACSSGCITNEVYDKISANFAALPGRPDYDGVITKAEADSWWQGGSGLPLYVDESKIALPGISTSTFGNTVGNSTSRNFLFSAPFSETAKTYGRLDMRLVGTKGEVKLGYLFPGVSPNGLVMDRYDFNHNSGETLRNWAADIGRPDGNGTDFDIHGYGNATVPVLPYWNRDIHR